MNRASTVLSGWPEPSAFLRWWTKLYGAVTLEAFDHLRFALDDLVPMFDYTLAEMAAQLGLEYPPQVAASATERRSRGA